MLSCSWYKINFSNKMILWCLNMFKWKSKLKIYQNVLQIFFNLLKNKDLKKNLIILCDKTNFFIKKKNYKIIFISNIEIYS